MKKWDDGITIDKSTHLTFDGTLTACYINKAGMELIAEYLGDDFFVEEQTDVAVNRYELWGESTSSRVTFPLLPVLRNRKWADNVSIVFVPTGTSVGSNTQFYCNYVVDKINCASKQISNNSNALSYRFKKLTIGNSAFIRIDNLQSDGTYKDTRPRQFCFFDNFRKMFYADSQNAANNYMEFDLAKAERFMKSRNNCNGNDWNFISMIPFRGFCGLIDEKIYEIVYTNLVSSIDDYVTCDGRLYLRLSRLGNTTNSPTYLALDVTDEED